MSMTSELRDARDALRVATEEREDAQEAAETYWEAWQDAAVYWKTRVEDADNLLEWASSHIIPGEGQDDLLRAIDRWRGIRGRSG